MEDYLMQYTEGEKVNDTFYLQKEHFKWLIEILIHNDIDGWTINGNCVSILEENRVRVDELIKEFIEKRNRCEDKPTADPVEHPTHYTSHPSGIECIEITRHYCFSIGNAIKYLWRAGLKQDADKSSKEKEIEDLRKAIWYINDRIKQLENE